MSFDPAPVAALRDLAPALPRGLVAQQREPGDAVRPRQAVAAALRAAGAWRRGCNSSPTGCRTCRSADPAHGAQPPRPAAADLDGAHARRPRARRALRRPDDLRGLSAMKAGARSSNFRQTVTRWAALGLLRREHVMRIRLCSLPAAAARRRVDCPAARRLRRKPTGCGIAPAQAAPARRGLAAKRKRPARSQAYGLIGTQIACTRFGCNPSRAAARSSASAPGTARRPDSTPWSAPIDEGCSRPPVARMRRAAMRQSARPLHSVDG